MTGYSKCSADQGNSVDQYDDGRGLANEKGTVQNTSQTVPFCKLAADQ
jgi:hypothetical protein